MGRLSRNVRLEQIADAALEAFTHQGFRLTQVATVAKLAGVAPGTIYLFADSKEQLFWLALSRAMGQPLEQARGSEPTMEVLRTRFRRRNASPKLDTWDGDPDSLPTLRSVLEEFWAAVAEAAPALKLVERCASDWPELAQAFYGQYRSTVLQQLAQFLEAAGEKGVCRRVEDPLLSARLIMETIAWFAMHRLGDPDGKFYDAEAARRTTLDALTFAFQATSGEPR